MSDLAIPTLQFTDFVVFATCGAVFACCWILRREKLHFLLLGASFFVCAGMAVWFVDFGYYGSVWSPLGWSAAGSLFWMGLRVFDGRSALTRPMIGFAVLPTSVHLAMSAAGYDAEAVNAGATLSYALHEGALAYYVLSTHPKSALRRIIGASLLAIAVAICLPLLPLDAAMSSLAIAAIFVVDHVSSILLTTCVLALEAEKAYQAVERQARLDPLTGALNRQGLASAIENLAARSAVIVADIDHFKSVNDRYGHSAGDDALREFSARVRSLLPVDGHLARFGGEEFVIVLPGHELTAATRLAEQVRIAIGSEPLRWNGHAIRMTVSLGLAMCEHGGNMIDAIEAADASLYEAKIAGRNRVQAA